MQAPLARTLFRGGSADVAVESAIVKGRHNDGEIV